MAGRASSTISCDGEISPLTRAPHPRDRTGPLGRAPSRGQTHRGGGGQGRAGGGEGGGGGGAGGSDGRKDMQKTNKGRMEGGKGLQRFARPPPSRPAQAPGARDAPAAAPAPPLKKGQAALGSLARAPGSAGIAPGPTGSRPAGFLQRQLILRGCGRLEGPPPLSP
ncbi:hypothetical protein GCM10023238_11670 [Streptomyces heliomycini]